MQIEVQLFSGNQLIATQLCTCAEEQLPFHKKMEACLLDACRVLGAPIPIWMDKNTQELGAFHQTTFTAEQFLEPVRFDRFLLRWLS